MEGGRGIGGEGTVRERGGRKRQTERSMFISTAGVLPGDKVAGDRLEPDGFPAIGTYLQEGDPLYR